VPLGLYLLLRDARGGRIRAASFIQAASLAAGFLGALVVVAVVLWRQGILPDAVYWTIGDHTVPHFFWNRAARGTLIFTGVCLPLLLGATMSIRAEPNIWTGQEAERNALVGLVLASAIGASAGGRFYSHYYIQLLPALILLAAPWYSRLFRERTWPRFGLQRIMVAWLALIVIVFSIARWWDLSLIRNPSEAGRYLRAHSTPDERIFIWGHAPAIYLDAQRRPACRYVLTFPLTGYLFGGPLAGFDTRSRILPSAWPNLLTDFRNHPPAFIVDAQSGPGALDPVRDFPILEELLAQQYQRVAQTSEGVIYRRR